MYCGWMHLEWQDRMSEKAFGKRSSNHQPPPDRIIWCYGQWQPMYLDIITTIPGIELNERIPDD